MPEELAEAWRAVILAEAAVSYAYGAAGPLLGDGERQLAAQAYDAHEQSRDAALLALTSSGAPPIGIPAFFSLPADLDGPTAARSLLATVESRLSLTYADLVAVLPMSERQLGIDGLLAATARALDWGAQPGPWGAAVPAD